MKNQIIAAIDLGSNAARLLIKSVEPKNNGKDVKFRKIHFLRVPLRLGDDVFTIGKISNEKEEKIIHTMKAFKQMMRVYNVDDYRICATSAFREAKNGEEIAKAVKEETDLKIHIISSKEEANILYGNHIEEGGLNLKSCAFVDVGGGSTEVTLIIENSGIDSTSYKVGTLRMLHSSEKENKIALDKMKTALSPYPICLEQAGVDIIGSGGNINKLFKLSASEKDKVNGKFSVETLKKTYEDMKNLSVEERMDKYDLKPDRADVIVPAAEIFLNIADAFKSKMIYVPSLGLADGIISDLYRKHFQKEKD